MNIEPKSGLGKILRGKDLKGLLKEIVEPHCHNQNHYGLDEGELSEIRGDGDPDLDSGGS